MEGAIATMLGARSGFGLTVRSVLLEVGQVPFLEQVAEILHRLAETRKKGQQEEGGEEGAVAQHGSLES